MAYYLILPRKRGVTGAPYTRTRIYSCTLCIEVKISQTLKI